MYGIAFSEGDLSKFEEMLNCDENQENHGEKVNELIVLFQKIQDFKLLDDSKELVNILSKIYSIFDEVEKFPLNAINDYGFFHCLAHYLVPERSHEATILIYKLIIKYFTDDYKKAKLAEDAGLFSNFLTVIDESEFNEDDLYLIILGIGFALIYFENIKTRFLENGFMRKIIDIINNMKTQDKPIQETLFLIEQVLEPPTDQNLIEVCYNFAYENIGNPNFVRSIFDVIGYCIDNSLRLKSNSISNGIMEFALKIVTEKEINQLTRVSALCLIRKLFDYQEELTYNNITVDFLKSIIDLIESSPEIQEKTLFSILQLSLNTHVVSMRILQSGILSKIKFILEGQSHYNVKINAALLATSLLCEDDVSLILKVYEATFDTSVELLLTSTHQDWQIQGLDAICHFIYTIQKHDGLHLLNFDEKMWFHDIIEDLLESPIFKISEYSKIILETCYPNRN